MKKILASLLFCSLMIVTKADEDYTYFHFTEEPQDEGTYTVYDTRIATYVTVHICPGSGVVCNITTTVHGVPFTLHTEKDKNKDSIEIVY